MDSEYSEDDMHDGDGDDSMDDGYHSGVNAVERSDDGGDRDDDDGDDLDFVNDTANSGDFGTGGRQKNFIVLKEDDIRRRQEDDITTVSTVLSVSRSEASILLRFHRWSASNLHEAWFADEDAVRKAVGLSEFRPVLRLPNYAKVKKLNCGICFETSPINRISSAACGHPFCNSCWSAYISTSINDGLGCLMLRCPDPSCSAAVGQDMISMLVSEEDEEKYARYLVRSYIEGNRKIKWCPAPGCEYAVEFVLGSENYDVTCLCSHGFCWNCMEEAHRPVDCGTVAKWILKNSSESENTNWILANSKPCPKCKRPIEKNQGCNHMTCRSPCKFQFCWICLGAWSDHGINACNGFDAAIRKGEYAEAERRREMARRSIERYTHYYERWATNHSSREKALWDLRRMQAVEKKLSDRQSLPESQLKFITKAWLQIVECRRVLKWTYAYGYYLPENEHAKRQLFEYSQGKAETYLERLHHCAEKDLLAFLGPESEKPQMDFNDFRTNLAGLTSVTGTYFENLVKALEDGLPDVDSQGTSSNSDDHGPWTCNRCTYFNTVSSPKCEMCHHTRRIASEDANRRGSKRARK